MCQMSEQQKNDDADWSNRTNNAPVVVVVTGTAAAVVVLGATSGRVTSTATGAGLAGSQLSVLQQQALPATVSLVPSSNSSVSEWSTQAV